MWIFYIDSHLLDLAGSRLKRAISVELPLNTGSLEMKVHVSDAEAIQDPDYSRNYNRDINWGEPRIARFEGSLRPPFQDTNRLFWEQAPVFVF